MFKIEVNVSGTTHGYYWLNKHADDFAQFLPAHFTNTHGEAITKEDITLYKVDEASLPLYEGKINQHVRNVADCDSGAAGVLRVCRHAESVVNEGDTIPLSYFTGLKAGREEIFADSSTPQTVNQPATTQYDFGSGLEDAIVIPAGHELAADFSTVELELAAGTALTQWPYDTEGNFLGNN